MLTESYLDTGNRHSYYQDQNIINIHNKNKSWTVDAAAPLVTNREIVEPIFNQIVQNIENLGLSYTPKTANITDDSDLYLVTNQGTVLIPTSNNKGKFIFKITSDIHHVRLISRTSKLSEVIGSFIGDRRTLGVLVGNITLVERNNIHRIDSHLLCPHIQGWDTEKSTLYRWTTGDAVLELPKLSKDTMGMLVIDVIAGGPYLLDEASNENENIQDKVG